MLKKVALVGAGVVVTLLASASACQPTVQATTAASACSPPLALPVAGSFDLGVGKILVSQAIQTTDPLNTVPLVAGRGTVVRVMVDSATSVPLVTGTLSITIDGKPVALGSAASPVSGPIWAKPGPNWATECDTLNFEIPAPNLLTRGNATFHVDLSGPGRDANPANDSGEVTLTLSDRAAPEIRYVPIDFDGTGYPDPALTQQGVADTFLRGIYPINDADPNLYQPATIPGITLADTDGDHVLGSATEGSALLLWLNLQRHLMVRGSIGPADNVFLFGYVKGNPIDGNGQAYVGGRVAYGNTDPARFQRTLAHEVGHDFGYGHPVPPPGDVIGGTGWDVGGRLAAGPAGNNITGDGRVKDGSSLYNIMAGGLLTNQAWISPDQYISMFNNDILAVSPDGASTDSDTIWIDGILNPAGTEISAPLTAFHYPWPSYETTPGTGRYAALVINSDGVSAAAYFDGLVSAPTDEAIHGAFEVPVRLDGEITSVQIQDTQTGQILASTTAPARRVSPRIQVSGPADGSTLGAETRLTWSASGFGQFLNVQVAYSPDNGQTFVPLAVQLDGRSGSTVLNTREIPRSGDATGMIRVLLSDGLNTTFADITGLTTSAAIY